MEQKYFESLYPSDARSAEIEKILGFVKEGNSCQIVSFPGVGRANLLGFLAYNRAIRTKHLGLKQQQYHFVMVQFTEVQKKPLVDVTKFLFLSLMNSLRERNRQEEYAKVNEIFKESLSFQDELILFQGLKRAIDFLAVEQKLTIVFLFDRFETYVPTVASEFFTNLRVLRNRAKYHFSVVFSLNRPLEDVLEPVLFADFYEFVAGHTIYLLLCDEPGLQFRIAYLEKITGKKLPQEVKDEVLRLTGGHGKLTRLCVETILASDRHDKELEEFLLSQKTVQGALFEIWYSLTPAEQKTLLSPSFDQAPYLHDIGLIIDGKITIPLFASFLTSVVISEKTSDEISYDETTNTIKKGDIALSDSLTAAEFRFLRYLLENREKVVDREEIITVVWKNAKSTAGVTDQAIDQLIFRLRKKIEENPNNPTHLLTVKGRGFKFND